MNTSMKAKSVSQRLPRFLSVVLAMSARAKSHVIEVQGASDSIYKSRPKEVAALIEEAARHAQDQ